MLLLPNNLPEEIRSAIQPELEHQTLEEFLGGVAQATLKLFAAEDVFLMLHIRDTQGGKSAEEEVQQFTHLANGAGAKSKQANDQFTKRWLESGIHYQVARDLHSRLAAISYSAFSWPYPRLGISSLGLDVGYAVPREYTLLLPFCADLTVREEREQPFFGYMMLLFEDFPALRDSVVQLIISLPDLLSNLTAAYLRRG